jgi:drug/metabolite transporter (DMT)-like permease
VSNTTTLAVAGLVFNAAAWGLSWWPFRQIADHGLHPLFATSIIFLLGVTAVVLARPQAISVFLAHRGLWGLALIAGINNACFNWAVTTGEVVRVVLLFYLMPVWAAFFARWLLQEPLGLPAFVRIGLGLAGAFIVLWQPGLGLPLPTSLPDWLAIVAGASFALNNVLLRRYAQVPGEARALAMFIGGLVFASSLATVLAAFVPASGVFWPQAAQGAWGYGLASAVGFGVVLLVSNITLQYGAARLAASTTAMIMLSEILFATGSAVWFGTETLQPRVVLGGALIILATVLAIIKREGPSPA